MSYSFKLKFNAFGLFILALTLIQPALQGQNDLSNLVYSGDVKSFYFNDDIRSSSAYSFNDDGTLLFVVSQNFAKVFEFTLSSPYDLSTAVMSGDERTFSVSAELARPRGLHFKPDGSKMFMVGFINGKIVSYDLSSPFDITTANYSGDEMSLDLSELGPVPIGITFNNEGNKLFVIDAFTGLIYEFDLTASYDLSSASLTGKTFLVSDQDDLPRAMAFNTAGDKMYVVGLSDKDLLQYTLREPFDIATAYFDGDSQALSLRGLTLGPTGVLVTPNNQVILSAQGDDGLFTFEFSEDQESVKGGKPYDISEADYERDLSHTFPLGGNGPRPFTFDFSADGSQMFVYEDGRRQVGTYNLATNFDVQTAVYAGPDKVLSLTDHTNRFYNFNFSPDGTKLFFLDPVDREIIRYNLGESYDLTTAIYGGVEQAFSVAGFENNPASFNFNADGTLLFISFFTDGNIRQFELTEPYVIHTAVYSGDEFSLNISGQIAGTYTFVFDPEGTKLFVNGSNSGFHKAYEYTLSTAFDLTTAVFTSEEENLIIEGYDLDSFSFRFNDTGTEISFLGQTARRIFTYPLETPYDLSSLIGDFEIGSAIPSAKEGFYSNFEFSDDGLKMYTSISDWVLTYDLSTAYDPSTASYAGDSESIQVISDIGEVAEITFGANGMRLFLVSVKASLVFEYHLTTPYDLSTATFAGWDERFITYDQERAPRSLRFNADGTKMILRGIDNNDFIFEYDLATPFDISTAVYAGDEESFSIAGDDPTNWQRQKIRFNADGTQMYLNSSSEVVEYSLQNPYDVSTATYNGAYNKLYTTEISQVRDMEFYAEGTKLMFMTPFGVFHSYDLTHLAPGILVSEELIQINDTEDTSPFTGIMVDTNNKEGSATIVLETPELGELTLGNQSGSIVNIRKSPEGSLTSQISAIRFSPEVNSLTKTTSISLKLIVNDGYQSDTEEITIEVSPVLPEIQSFELIGNPAVNSTELQFTVNFSEAVEGVDMSSFTLELTGDVVAEITELSGSLSTYSVAVQQVSGEGTLALKLSDDYDIVDLGGAALEASDLQSTAHVVDTEGPEPVLSTEAEAYVNAPFEVMIAFNETVEDFSLDSFTITNGTLSAFSSSEENFMVQVSPVTDGPVTINIEASKVTDVYGNENVVSNTIERIYDATAPVITLSSATDAPVNGIHTVTATFTESVTGFEASDISLATGGSLQNFSSVDEQTYTFEVTSDLTNEIALDIAADGAFDRAQNGNLAAESLVLIFNTVPTVIQLTNNAVDENNQVNQLIGTLTTTDPDETETFVYELISGEGDTDNTSFEIAEDELKSLEIFDFETKTSYSIRVKSTDSFNNSIESVFSIEIVNVPEPILRVEENIVVPDVGVTQSEVFTVGLFNDGDGALEISEITYPAAFTGSAGPLTLEAGASFELEVTFSPSARQEYSGDIQISSDGGNTNIPLSGNGILIVSIENENDFSDQIELFPNPANTKVELSLVAFNAKEADIKVIDNNGKEKLTLNRYQGKVLILDVSSYEEGLYIIRISSGDQLAIKKLLIKRE